MAEQQAIIDTTVFKTSKKECNGCNDCPRIERIITALSYYDKLSSKDPNTFTSFCDKYYSKRYLEDYIHLISVHKNDASTDQLENKTCTGVRGCTSTTRHYRDRSQHEDIKADDTRKNMYFDIFDSLHFYIYHMEECGLRISLNEYKDDSKDIDDDNYSDYRDEVIATIQNEIEIRRQKCGSFRRLDNTTNSKFNMMQINYENDDETEYSNGKSNSNLDEKLDEKLDDKSDENTNIPVKKQKNRSLWKNIQSTMGKYFGKKEIQEKAQKEKTFTDELFEQIGSNGVDEAVVSDLRQHLIMEEYDTDSIKNDIDIYCQQKKCNLLEATRYSLNCIEEIKTHMKMHNATSAAFSTGFAFWYWGYYKYVDDEQIRQQQGFSTDENNFEGYGVEELFVSQ
eukprot:87650_1